MEISEEQYARFKERLKSARTYEDLTGPQGAFTLLMKPALEELLEAELTEHLGYEPYEPTGRQSGNSRNGTSKKTVQTSEGPVELDVPRDRNGTFEPVAVKKHQRRLGRMEDAVVAMYARGMSTRDIQRQIEEIYGAEMSAAMVSQITGRILALVAEWQNRALEAVYAVVFFDAIHFKVHSDGKVITKAAYTCLGITLDGRKDLLGIWIEQTESASFWLGVLTDLRQRGTEDILIACVDGVKGFPAALEAAFPATEVQLCVIHQIRSSTKHVSWKDIKAVMRSLKAIYDAPTREGAETALTTLEATWGSKYPLMVKSWKTNWPLLSTYFKYPHDLRKMIYTTNAVEAMHRQFRKVTKAKPIFPDDDALRKILYLAFKDLSVRWTRPIHGWSEIFSHLCIIFDHRLHAYT